MNMILGTSVLYDSEQPGINYNIIFKLRAECPHQFLVVGGDALIHQRQVRPMINIKVINKFSNFLFTI